MKYPEFCPLCQTKLIYFELNFMRKGAYTCCYCPVQIETPKPIHLHNFEGHFGCYRDYTNTFQNVPKTFHYEYEYANESKPGYNTKELVVLDGYYFYICLGYTNVRRYDLKKGEEDYHFVPMMLTPNKDIVEQFKNFNIL